MRSYLLLLTFCGVCAAQSIEGFVEDSATRLPVAGAIVSFGGPTVNDHYLAISDRSGHFWRVFPQAIPFSVVVSRAGYVTPEKPLSVTPGPDSANLRISLTPQAVISGKLVDEDGFPVEGARLEAMRYEVVDGQRKLRPAGAAGTSNDLGEYRIAGLPAGTYSIRATPSSNASWDHRYVPQYYPGSLEPLDGNAVPVATGQEVGGVAFHLKKYEGVTLTCRVVLPPGANSTPRMRVVFLQSTDGTGYYAGQAFWQPENPNFVIRHVPPGNYILQASSFGGPSTNGVRTQGPGDMLARQEVQVAGTDLNDVVLTFRAVDASGK